jgi:serine/threonine protein phosphatase PrpC
MLTQEQIEKVLNEEEIDLEEKLIKLVRKCNVRGGLDNISIAILDKRGASK